MPDDPEQTPVELQLSFKDNRSRDIFLHYLSQVQAGKIHNPSVSLMLEALTHPLPQPGNFKP